MACKLNSLFSVGEEFDDEDLLQADWSVPSVVPSTTLQSGAGTTSSSDSQQAIPVTFVTTTKDTSNSGTLGTNSNVTVQTPPVLGLRGFTAPKLPPAPLAGPPSSVFNTRTNNILTTVPAHQNSLPTASHNHKQDDFDDWDVDLADLDDNPMVVPQTVPIPHRGHPTPSTSQGQGQARTVSNSGWPGDDLTSPAKMMRTAACFDGSTPTPSPSSSMRGFSFAAQTPEPPFGRPTPFRGPLAPPGPSPAPSPGGPFKSPGVLHAPPCSPIGPRSGPRGGFSSSMPSPVTPRMGRPLPPGPAGSAMRQPGGGHMSGGLFQSVSPRPPPPTPSPRSLHTPVMTNHLVQLVSASKKTPQRTRSDPNRPKTRRFPGPAGMLPQQLSGKSLDDIVVAVPQTPAHGAVARRRTEVPSSQPADEEDFSGGGWAAMKAEMGLDEKNPSCFLHSYSVVMVLRKAALKQLNKNKVPNMAVVLKSILHTHADAKAVFKDPTGEMQGTVHRRLLEERQAELKIGAVLLLKQVGVFSPSHRNHYLNVTPNNLLRIYPPDGSLLPCTPLSQQPLGLVDVWDEGDGEAASRTAEEPVSEMELRFDDDDDDDDEEEESTHANIRPHQSGQPQTALPAPAHAPVPSNPAAWDTDDLDELLGELPV
ncbi:homologous recombination OB-fold protein [Engraulis encrasicolus]|uniref:homologous recombination OB-fold protein n=1 Tax=Engraulis encrasicolus TaxID=184585 RepID=UPI002FCFD92C